MRRLLCTILTVLVAIPLAAQNTAHPTPKPAPAATSAGSANSQGVASDLPVRKVVLYKNGVGYFEHTGHVNGDQSVAIDFTSSQLNDVLQSLTALDSNGGKVSTVSYNSTTPVEQQLESLALGLKNDADTPTIYTALRGQRVQVAGAGAPFTGRLVNIESHSVTDKNGNTSDDRYYLIVKTDDGALRTAELTDALSVHMLDPSLEKQFASYLEIIGSAQNLQGRHLTLEDRGQGQRQLQVSYISEVPVWKSTYRIVFPREDGDDATVQGWAVVDNTVGVDWNNVQLSLVAGAPQSFIQPLSEPIYTRRPEIPIATEAQTTPQTHEAAETHMEDKIEMASKLYAAPGAASQSVTVEATGRDRSAGGLMTLHSGEAALARGGGMGSGYGGGYGPGVGGNAGGGVYRPSDAIQQGDVSTNAFDDFFEYAIAQPVTIHKNESAMVPILQQELPASHVTLWSDTDTTPLRALWLENKSKLTLDSGSFSIFENGEFAGEGLLDPIHPGEKRLLSYAVDQAVKVHRGITNDTRTLRHIAMQKGIFVETTSEVTENTYTVTNGADEARSVVVEHTRERNAKLDSDVKPEETTATSYRFRVPVEPHQSADLHIKERADLLQTIDIRQSQFRDEYLVNVSKYSPQLEEKLRPLINAQSALNDIDGKLQENAKKQTTLAADEARDRDNLTALKGNDAAKRFVDELNQSEDALQTARKDQADLEKQRDAAQAQVEDIIAKLQFETDLDIVSTSTR
jgi:hypothetical protein